MADISKIQGSNGTIYNFKDAVSGGELADAKGSYDSFSDRLDGYDTTFGKVSDAIQGLIDTRIEPSIETNIRLTKSAGGVCKPNLNMVIKNTWVEKTWSGLTSFSGYYIWTDGDNIYYSNGSTQKVLDKSTSTWNTKTWSGLTSFDGRYIWTNGEKIYYSGGSSQYVLNKSTSTWSTKSWNGLSDFYGSNIWTDGENIYYSNGLEQNDYKLTKSTIWSETVWIWSEFQWTSLTYIDGSRIWSDGENIYYSSSYVYTNGSWSSKSWSGLPSYFYSDYIWSDGENIYYSYATGSASYQYVLNKSTSTWSEKTWNGLTSFRGNNIWTDGGNIYYSDGSKQYVLTQEVTTTNMPSCKP